MLNNLIFIVSLILYIFILWVLYVYAPNAVFSNNDFWDYVLLLLGFYLLGLFFNSYIIFIVLGLVATIIFIRLKSYFFLKVFDFYSVFVSFLILSLIYKKDFYFVLLILFSILVNILLRFVSKGGYGVSISFFIFSIIYYFNPYLWILHKNYVYNLNISVLMLLTGLLFILLKIFFSKSKDSIENLMKKKM